MFPREHKESGRLFASMREYSGLFFGILLLFVFTILWFVPTALTIRKSASTLARESARRVGSNIESTMHRSADAIASAAEEVGITPDRYEFILKRLLGSEDGLQSVSLIGMDGSEMFHLDRIAVHKENMPLPQPAVAVVRNALAGEAGIGEIFFSDILEPRTYLAAPVRTIGKVKGVIVGEFNLRPLISFLQDTSLPEGHIYVVDKNGFQILHPELSEFLRHPNYLSRGIVQKVITERRVMDGLGALDGYKNDNGVTVFAVGMPLDVGGWSIFTEQPQSIAFASVWQTLFIALGIIVFGALALILLFRNHRFLVGSNIKLKEMLVDLDNSGKMLVRRDLDLSRANARLLELDDMKSQFVSTAAHQLRTPLTVLKWSLNELLEGDFGSLKKNQKELLTDVVAANKRLINLVNDLLNIARLEDDQGGMKMERQDIATVMKNVISQFQKVLKEKNIKFSFEHPRDSLYVVLDKEKMGIALYNLIDNAIKYTLPKGSILVTLVGVDKEIHISVKDTGIGIPEEEKERIFSKFFRAHNAMLMETYGSGLGLSVVKDIAEKHHGSIAFRKNEGSGSTFILTVPAA